MSTTAALAPTSYATGWKHANVLPATHAWAEPMPSDAAGRRAFFDQHGFLIIKGAVEPELIEACQRELARLARDHREIPPVREGFNVEDPAKWPTPNQPVFRKIGGIYDLSFSFRTLCAHPRIMAQMVELYGPVIELHRDVVMMKQAQIGREKPWHQDAVYWPWRPMELCSALTCLDPMHRGNGALQIVPGTHRLGPIAHQGDELHITLSSEQQAAACYVELEPGDTLLFHALLLHGSEPNRSSAHRRVTIFSYKTPNLRYEGEGTRPPSIVVHRA